MAISNHLAHQLAHLVARTNAVKAMPMLARAAHVDALLTLQLDLLGSLVDRVNELETTKANRKIDL